MPSLQLKLEQDNTRYTMPQLIQLRRQMLRFARSLPPGPERNGRRQIAASLRSLVRNTKWLAAHTIEAPVKEYRVYTVDTEGHFIKTIKLDGPDDPGIHHRSPATVPSSLRMVKVSASFSTRSASACVVVAHTLPMIGNRTSTTEPAVRSFSIAAAGLRK